MKRIGCLILALLLSPAILNAGDLSIGFGYPYVSAKYDFKVLSAEARYATGSGINIYAARGYWNFHREDPLKGFAGVEAGYIKFNTLNMTGTGYEAALFVGGQYRMANNLYLLMDFAPTMIMLRHSLYTDVSVAGIEFVVNAAVYYRFGGGRADSWKAYEKKPEPAPAPEVQAVPAPAAPQETPSELSEGALLGNLYSKDWKERRQAAFELGKIRSGRAAEPLKNLMLDENDRVRGVAALALTRIIGARAMGPLLELLKDPSDYVRATAAKALGGLKDKRALKGLRPLLKDSSPEVRKASKDAIKTLITPDQKPAPGRP